MIFVTVGTHEQQFDRLVKYIDELKASGIILEDVMIQTGYCEYKPKACDWKDFLAYPEMVAYVNKARIVITHGGPSSFLMPLQIGKVPIVVPRKKELGEHVNDHQVNFCETVAQRQGNIILVEDVKEMADVIQKYDSIIASMPAEMKSNNARFCEELEKIVNEMF